MTGSRIRTIAHEERGGAAVASAVARGLSCPSARDGERVVGVGIEEQADRGIGAREQDGEVHRLLADARGEVGA